jgi:2,5-diamino-6-(ribosylamino)-4(3H)-pyrimidinone 5'-phosphate reductase
MTTDGKIATASGDSSISSKRDLRRVHKLRVSVDAVVVGISTVVVDDPQLTVRLVKGRDPVRVIVDSRGRIPLDSKILQTASKIKTIVAVTKCASEEKIYKIRETGATVMIVPSDSNNLVDLKELLLSLKKRGIKKILVEGGGELNWSLLNTGMVDELIVTIGPIIAGGRTAKTLVEGEGYKNISEGIKLRLKKIVRDKTEGEVTLYYKPYFVKKRHD